MKKIHLTNGIVAALLLASPIAGAKTKYPAADFQPEVIYQDAEYIGKGAAKPAPKAKSTSARSSRADSKYPAATFEPEVVFQDAEQIKKVEQAAKAVAAARRTAAPASSGQASAGAGESGGMMENYWVGLIALALAGFAVLYSRRPKPEVNDAPAYTIDASGLTGVARYMRMKAMSGPTGVQKYIEKHGKKSTGVEKYLRRRG